LTTDAKHIVVVKAKDFLTSAVTVEDFEDAEQEKPEFVQVEDVGGFAAESDMEEDVGEVTKELTKCVLPHSDDPEVILSSLFRSKDVADARACLSHKAMKDQSTFALEVEQVFGKLVRLKYESRSIVPQEHVRFGSEVDSVLLHQAQQAKLY
jgi:hypothetical protein